MFANATPGGAVAGRSRLRATSDRTNVARRPARRFMRMLAAVCCSALFGCGSSSVIGPGTSDVEGLDDAEVVLIRGDGQEGVVASLLSESLVVEVRGADGSPIAGAPITWEFYGGQGFPARLPLVAASTDANGRASILWELGRTAGWQQASARIMLPDESSAPSGASAASPAAGGPSPAPPEGRGRKNFVAKASPDAVRDESSSTPIGRRRPERRDRPC
jgi:hypothetical protein